VPLFRVLLSRYFCKLAAIPANPWPRGILFASLLGMEKKNILLTGHYNEKEYCCYCGKQFVYPLKWNIEHLVPVSKGGNNSSANKRKYCVYCKAWRGNKPLSNWKKEIQALIELRKNKPFYNQYDLKIMIENIGYWQHYIDTAKEKLLKKPVHA